MKKIPFIFAAAFTILFSGCSTDPKVPPLTLSADTDCTIKINGTEYKCNIKYLSDSVDAITISSPPSLSGLTFRHADGKFSLSYDALLCRFESIELPSGSFPVTVMNIMQQLRLEQDSLSLSPSSDGSCYTYSGETQGCCYTIKTDSSGQLKEISAAV